MKNERRTLNSQGEIALPKWFGAHRRQIRSVVNILFRVSCWSIVAWVVWNHALSNFLNFDSIGPWHSFGFGVLLSVVSLVWEDAESNWGMESPSR